MTNHLPTCLSRKLVDEEDITSHCNLASLLLNVRESTPSFEFTGKQALLFVKLVILRRDWVTVPSYCCERGYTERCTETLHFSGEECFSDKSKSAPECLRAMSSYFSAVKDIRKSQAGNYFQVNNLFNKFRYFPFMNCTFWVQENTVFFNSLYKNSGEYFLQIISNVKNEDIISTVQWSQQPRLSHDHQVTFLLSLLYTSLVLFQLCKEQRSLVLSSCTV